LCAADTKYGKASTRDVTDRAEPQVQPNDEHLLRSLGTDTDALAEFYRRHVERVLTFVVRRVHSPEDAADLTQAVFVAVIDCADRFDPRRGTAIGWLYGVATNTVASWRRQQARGADAALRAGGHRLLDADEYALLEDRLAAAHVASRVREGIAALPAGQRSLLELMTIDGLTAREAAQAVGIHPAAARMQLTRARRRVRRHLDVTRPDPPAGASRQPTIDYTEAST